MSSSSQAAMYLRVQQGLTILLLCVLVASCATESPGPEADGSSQRAVSSARDFGQMKGIYCLKVAGSQTQHFITGSNHFAVFFRIEVSDQIKTLVQNSDVLLLEATLPPIREELIESKRLHKSMAQLEPPLPNKLIERIDQYLRKDRRFARQKWMRLNPIAVLQQLEVQIGMPPPRGMSLDAQFVRAARRGQNQIDGIEHMKEQVLVFNQVSTQEWEKLFQTLLDQIESEEKGDQFLEAVRQQYGAIADARWDDFDSRVRAYDNYIAMTVPLVGDVRNPEIADRIVSRLSADQRSHFIAIGAAHMGGPKGVLNLLRARGAIVEKNCEAAALSN